MLKLTKPIASIDLETTGVNPGTDRIVEIGILKVLPDGTRNVKRKLINPEIPIPKTASDVHDQCLRRYPLGERTQSPVSI